MKKLILAVLPLVPLCAVHGATHYQNSGDQALERNMVSDDLVVLIRTNEKIYSDEDLAAYLADELNLDSASAEVSLILSRPAKAPGLYRTLFQVKLINDGLIGVEWGEFLRTSNDIIQLHSNYEYVGEPREAMKFNDPLYPRQAFHSVMQNQWAWVFTLGASDTVVAVTDDGVDIDHEDLKKNIWVNEFEIPNNGLDDDLNGYVDDVHGWDFASGDNDPRPKRSFFGGDHGTHVAGIIAAVGNNNKGVVGVAPKVKVMPIRFYGSGAWTSAKIARSYAYAIDNGAKIISTSYNIDQFVGDAVFEEALDYGIDAGIIHFNSAGNGSAENPPRQAFDQLIFVCSTQSLEGSVDRKSGFSNWGDGVDLCAPGSDIYSTVPGNRYESFSGTSMATPAAAGVAALIWSANPGFSRDQVLASLLGSSDNIDADNPLYEGGLGSGRTNSFASLLSKPLPPRISRAEKVLGENEEGVFLDAIEVHINQVLRTFDVENKKNWHLIHAGFDGRFGTADDQAVEMNRVTRYRIGTNVLRFEIEPTIRFGRLRFFARSGGLKDPFNQDLDGNGDGQPGDHFMYEFDLAY